VFIMLAFSFFKPQTSRDWRTFGTFAAFIVALFVEMYGFPLTLYVLSGWLQTKYPSLDLLSHNSGHLWSTLLGESGDPHFSPLHIASYIFIGGGFWLLSSAWTVLYHAQRHAQLAVSGPYARIRHPQYVAFVAILFGFLLQWPTLLTLLMTGEGASAVVAAEVATCCSPCYSCRSRHGQMCQTSETDS
ncbi:methyltransferase family protein, partial [Pseudomonas aeruginosa]|uniref:methyltransferase family protein n=1 Tax=Pseudomonas aeruginosa TaxID=287 RepID=UPI002119C724